MYGRHEQAPGPAMAMNFPVVEDVSADREVPAPELPALAQTINWIFRPLQFMEGARDRLGDVFSVRVLGWAKLVLVSDPELIKAIFSYDPEVLQTGKANDLMGPVVGRRSVFLLDGTQHRQVRRILVNAFNLEASRRAAAFSARRAIEIATERCDSRFHDIHRMFREIALGTMLEALFGSSERATVEEYDKQFRLILGGLSAYLAYLRFLQKDFGPGTPGWWVRTKVAGLHRLIERDLARADHAEAGVPALEIRDTLKALGRDDTSAMVLDQIVSLIVAGHDTVASALSWSTYWLLKNPTVIEALRDEIRTADDASEPGAIENAPLLEAVCLEALRLVPTVEIVSRQAVRDLRIGGYRIAEGSLVSPCAYLLHRNKALYPTPAEFKPERFLGRQFSPHEFIPFGGGLRRCLGSTLGILEMKAVIAALLRNFDMKGSRLDSVRARRRNVTIAPSPHFRVSFSPRAARGRSGAH
jgi:cytochrome P450